MRLTEYLSAWHEALKGPRPTEQASRALGFPAQRLQVYCDLVRNNRNAVLKQIFPRVHRVCPELFRKEVLEEYFSSHPPGGWDLNKLGQPFPEYVRSLVPSRSYLAELALYDWAIDVVNLHDSDTNEIRRQLSPSQLTLSPATFLMSFEHQILDWVDALDSDEVAPVVSIPAPGNELLIASRAENPFRATFTKPSPLATQLLLQVGDEVCEKQPLVEGLESVGFSQKEIEEELSVLLDQCVLLQGRQLL